VKRNGGAETVVRYLRTLADAGAELSDGQLLGDFVARHEESSFRSLVTRHGPMVWGVCRRLLHDPHDAEDAFQATFLVLARRAGTIVPGGKVGNWLYGVAYQTARKARATRAKRRTREVQLSEGLEPITLPFPRNDLSELIDDELSRLPDKYRAPIVLCELEGKTHREAAEQLGWPVGTVSGRLSRAKAILAKRLTQRGATPAGSVSSVLFFPIEGSAAFGMPVTLVYSTAKAASLFAAGQGVTEGVSLGVVALTREVMKSMFWSKIKFTSAVTALTVFALTLIGMSFWEGRSSADAKPIPEEKIRVTVNEVFWVAEGLHYPCGC
jgi:RNA polymerase sigma factor (sigma-70 family)